MGELLREQLIWTKGMKNLKKKTHLLSYSGCWKNWREDR